MHLLGIDVGTSSVKCVIVDEDLNVVSSSSEEIKLYTPKPQYYEQLPEDWWHVACKGIKAALHIGKIPPGEIVGIGFSGQMHGLVPLDNACNVLRPAILWNDLRTVHECDEILRRFDDIDELLDCTNNYILPGYTIPKIIWLKNHEPEIFEKLDAFVLPKDYIRYKLTGEIATDVTDASGTGIFDVKNQCWSSKMAAKLGIDEHIFPKVYDSDDVTGVVTKQAAAASGLEAGTLVFGGAGDGVCQSTGMGVVNEDVLGVIVGTSGVVSSVQQNFSRNENGKLQYFCNCVKGEWITLGCQLNSGASVDWLNKKILNNGSDFTKLNELAEGSSAGAGDLLFLPYLGGERCPYNDATARGVFFGLTYDSDLGDMARATMEGVTFGLKQIFDLIKSCNTNFTPSYVISSGGSSNSQIWLQIQADIFGLPIKTVKGSAKGGAYGAALIAGVGKGIWKDLKETTAGFVFESVTVPSRQSARYNELYPVFCNLYENIKGSFGELSKLK
ncbi:MAG: xylulokinase [Eubacteriales bacterium]|nr:xylulokinase [Eubacteriales bacterium]